MKPFVFIFLTATCLGVPSQGKLDLTIKRNTSKTKFPKEKQEQPIQKPQKEILPFDSQKYYQHSSTKYSKEPYVKKETFTSKSIESTLNQRRK